MLLTTVIAAVVVLLDLRQKELAHARGEVASLTRILSDQTTRTFESVALTMRATRERLSDDIGQRFELDSPAIQALLQARTAGLPQLKSMFLVSRDGFGVNSSRTDFIRDLPVHDREFFRHFTQGNDDNLFISRPEKARVDGQWTYYASLRLLDGEGQLRGVLVTAISIDYFEALYESVGLDHVSRIALLSRDGVLLAGSPHEETQFGKPAIDPAVLAELGALPEGRVKDVNQDIDGGRRFLAVRQVAKFPLLISVAIDEHKALAPWRHIARPIAAGAVTMLLCILMVTVLMVKYLVRKGVLELRLKESGEQLRHLVQSVKDAIITIDAGGRVVLFNGAAERMFGVRATDAVGIAVGDVFARCLSHAQGAKLMHQIEAGWRASESLDLLTIIELNNGERELPVELNLSPTLFHGDRLLTAVFRDLTERRYTERQLLETNRQLKELSAAIQNVREQQRAKISRELHDELGQQLTGIRMEIAWFGKHLAGDPAPLQSKLASIKTQIDQTIASVRRISSELRPLVLDDLGFAAAANWYVDQFSVRTGLPVDLQLPDRDPERGHVVATALFRILQESLTNIARYAEATRVGVRLVLEEGDWRLSVSDDGIGFEYDPGRLGDIGLVGMRERTQTLGGHFSVTTAPGNGTRIDASIPDTSPENSLAQG